MTDRSEANQCLLLLKVPGDTDTPLYQRSQGIPTLMSHKSTTGDTNTPVNTAERLTLIQRQSYRLCRTYRLFSFRLTLPTEESPYGRQQLRSFKWLSFIHTDINELLISSKRAISASYTALYVPLKYRCRRSLTSIPNK